MAQKEFSSGKKKKYYFGAFVLFGLLIELLFHHVLKTEIVYTHFFYIPVVLAAYWWGIKGGLLISAFYGFIHVCTHLLGFDNLAGNHDANTYLYAAIARSFIFIAVGFLVGLNSKERRSFEEELIQSKIKLEEWGHVLEDNIKEKTRSLSVLFKVSKVASSTLNLQDMLKKILEIFMILGDAKSGAVLLAKSESAHYCWEIKDCANFNCPIFKSVNKKCWEVAGVSYCGDGSDNLASRLNNCIVCKVFQEVELVPTVSRNLDKEALAKLQAKIKKSPFAESILKRKPITLANMSKGNKKKVESLRLTENFVAIPLMTDDQAIGILCLLEVEEKEYGDENMDIFSTAARQVAVAARNAQLYNAAELMALTDDLTELHNYRSFQTKLLEEIERANRSGHPLSVGILDLDNFKLYNDNFGHIAGNKILREFAQLLKDTVRIYDIVARYGGDEFCIIFPETGKEKALETVERLRDVVEKYEFPLGNNIPGGLTVSTGIAVYPSDARNMEELIIQADKALYAAKKAGRNLIRTAKPLEAKDLLRFK